MGSFFAYYKVEKYKNICHLQQNACNMLVDKLYNEAAQFYTRYVHSSVQPLYNVSILNRRNRRKEDNV